MLNTYQLKLYFLYSTLNYLTQLYGTRPCVFVLNTHLSFRYLLGKDRSCSMGSTGINSEFYVRLDKYPIEQSGRPGICAYATQFALWSTRHRWKQTTSPLNTHAHDSRFELSNLRLFLSIRSSNADKCTVLGCHDHKLNTGHKRRLSYFCKDTEVVKKGILSGLFSAAYQNGDQYYDFGPLWSISGQFELSLSSSQFTSALVTLFTSASITPSLPRAAMTPAKQQQFSQMLTFNRGQQMTLNIQICPLRNASVFTKLYTDWSWHFAVINYGWVQQFSGALFNINKVRKLDWYIRCFTVKGDSTQYISSRESGIFLQIHLAYKLSNVYCCVM